MKRVYSKDFNTRAVESLIKCGALDSFSLNRREMMLNLGSVISSVEATKRRNIDGQIGLFDLGGVRDNSSPEISHTEEFDRLEMLGYEKETTGLYISGHPMAEYSELSKRIKAIPISDLLEAAGDEVSLYKDGAYVKAFGIISSVKKKITKNIK